MAIPKNDEKLQTKIITDSGNTYICVSSIGTPETEARWAITKIDATGNTTYPLDDTTQKVVYSFKFLISEVLNLRYGYKYTLPPLLIPENIQGVDFYENNGHYLNKTNTPSITWDTVDGADSYEVSIDNGVTTFEVLTNSFSISDLGLNTDDTYEIKVRAIRGEESSDFSVGFTFIRDITTPSLNSNSINIPSNANGSGTLNFSENVTLSGLSLVKASDGTPVGGSVSVSSGSGTPNITLSISTPILSGVYVIIIGTATDDAGNSDSFESTPWELL